MIPTGHLFPPLLLFPEKNMKLEMMNGTPLASVYICHPSEWIECELFTQYFLHFLKNTNPAKEDTVIPALDGQYSHTRNRSIINIAEANHVDIICLLPYDSRKQNRRIKPPRVP